VLERIGVAVPVAFANPAIFYVDALPLLQLMNVQPAMPRCKRRPSSGDKVGFAS